MMSNVQWVNVEFCLGWYRNFVFGRCVIEDQLDVANLRDFLEWIRLSFQRDYVLASNLSLLF